MSEAIKRFYPDVRYIGSGDYVGCMEAEADGEYVLYSDHAVEVERLRGLLAKPGPIEAALNARVREVERGLSDAEEAIRDLVGAGDAMRFSMPTAAMAGKSAWDDVRSHPAVRRALGEIGGEG